MNQFEAAKDTIEKLKTLKSFRGCEGATIEHFEGMIERWPHDKSEAKQGRWLGYIQGAAVVATAGEFSLDSAKQINMAHS